VTTGCLQATPKSKIARDREMSCTMGYRERAELLRSLKGHVHVLIHSSQWHVKFTGRLSHISHFLLHTYARAIHQSHIKQYPV
jgi:hypothetical protein